MEALECIKTRRSIRKFTEQPVTEDEVRQVVEAAAFAPSWKNTQIARYIVVTDKEKKDKLADNILTTGSLVGISIPNFLLGTLLRLGLFRLFLRRLLLAMDLLVPLLLLFQQGLEIAVPFGLCGRLGRQRGHVQHLHLI